MYFVFTNFHVLDFNCPSCVNLYNNGRKDFRRRRRGGMPPCLYLINSYLLIMFIFCPIKRPSQVPIRCNLLSLSVLSRKLITFLSITSPMSQLQVVNVTWMTTFTYWNNVINTWTKWVRILQALVDRLATNTTNSLRLEYLLLVALVYNTVGT